MREFKLIIKESKIKIKKAKAKTLTSNYPKILPQRSLCHRGTKWSWWGCLARWKPLRKAIASSRKGSGCGFRLVFGEESPEPKYKDTNFFFSDLLIPESLNLVEREGEENLRSEHERRLSGARTVRRRLMVMTTHELLGGCKVGSLMRANLSVVVVVVVTIGFFFFFSCVHVSHITHTHKRTKRKG